MNRTKTIWYQHQEKTTWRPDFPECSMYDFLKENAKKTPDLSALYFEGKRVSYREMMKAIERAARAFLALGVRQKDMVTIISPNIPQAVYAFYALNCIGAVGNMLHPELSPAEIKSAVLLTESRFVVVLDIFYPKVQGISWPEGCAPKSVVLRISDALPPLKKAVYQLRERKISGAMLWKDFLKNGEGQTLTRTEVAGDDTAAIMYSGGTSGEAKGVMLTNRNFNALAVLCYDAMGIVDVKGMKVLDILPVFHGTGLGFCIHLMLCNGFQVYMIPLFEAKKCFRLIFKEKIEFLAGVPAFYDALARSREMETKDCSFMRVVGTCGDVMRDSTRDRLNAYLKKSGSPVTVTNGYGMTECTAGCCYDPQFLKKPGTSGMMAPDMLCKIVEPGTEKELPVGETGELCIAGPTVMKGYYRAEEATAKTLRVHEDGITWLHSGDAFSLDSDGYLTFHQRLDRMFVVSGFNIYPGVIESKILEVAHVQQCCVVGKEAPVVGRRIVAYVIADDCDEIALETEIRRHCRETLAEYSQPSQIVMVKEFPRTRMKKVDYRALEKSERDDLK